ncbi:metallophosphoesterase family protein [Microcoleus sp. CAWBG640]|uniref:metallophosphoesterase family protein n=1 Tax=Microcoleus sp. CAWBG640 TaxID=2841653 RepID=UPI00312B6A4E
MKTAIVSDIHGNWDGFNTVLADINSRQVERIICLGDVVDGGDQNNAVVDWLKANNITTVRGNHDENYDCPLEAENKNWLNQLPKELVEKSVLFTHISPLVKQKGIKNNIEAWNVFDETNFRLVFIGHIHFPALFGYESECFREAKDYKVDCGSHYLNPTDRYIISFGAVGYPRGGGQFIRYGIFDSDENIVEFIKLKGTLLPYGLCYF